MLQPCLAEIRPFMVRGQHSIIAGQAPVPGPWFRRDTLKQATLKAAGARAGAIPPGGFRFAGIDEYEPRILELLDARLTRRALGAYWPLDKDEVARRLTRMLEANGLAGCTVANFVRMAGGASKEQFSFDLTHPDGQRKKQVLRIDPRESIVETCRYREAEALLAFEGVVPIAPCQLLDGDGTYMGQPAVILSFIDGVIKPPIEQGRAVTGVGITLDDAWRAKLSGEFIDVLARIHAFDWRSADLPHFAVPTRPLDAALWNVNWWAKIWREDEIDPYPFLTYAERWMRERLPECTDPVFNHGDYRFGNYLFDPATAKMTAMLDWELAHIGDFHSDLGWACLELFGGAPVNGEVWVSGLMQKDAFIRAYEERTGRTVNRKTLAFYEVLAAFKGAVMNIGTSNGLAIRQTNHQDVLQCWITAVGHPLMDQMARVMRAEEMMA